MAVHRFPTTLPSFLTADFADIEKRVMANIDVFKRDCNSCKHFGHDLEDYFCMNPKVTQHFGGGWFGQISHGRSVSPESPCGPARRLHEVSKTVRFELNTPIEDTPR